MKKTKAKQSKNNDDVIRELLRENEELRSFANYLLGDDRGPDLDAYLKRDVAWPISLSTVNYQKKVLEDEYKELGEDAHRFMRERDENAALALAFKNIAARLGRDGGQAWDLMVARDGVEKAVRSVSTTVDLILVRFLQGVECPRCHSWTCVGGCR